MLSLKIFGLLLWRDLSIFLKDFGNTFLNSFIWVALMVGVAIYFLPNLGIPSWYGGFILAGSVATVGFTQAMLDAEHFVSDLQGCNKVSYDLTLPISQRMIFFQRGILCSCRAMLLALPVFPIGKALFWFHVDLTNFSIVKFILIFLASNFMYGFMAIWLISFIYDIDRIMDLWMRIYFPLWLLGCYQFSWYTMFKVSQPLGYIALMNPILYIMEATRSATLGEDGFLNIWLCTSVIVFFTIVFGLRGISLLRKRLDCI